MNIIFLSPKDSQCRDTASILFDTAKVFVSLSVAAWLLILFGYFTPFCIVAVLLTLNGYSPVAEMNDHDQENGHRRNNFGVFPISRTNDGAPPDYINHMTMIALEHFKEDYARECCICLAEFHRDEEMVITECEHIFHKGCCQEWLKQARSCPVCRRNIVNSSYLINHEIGQDNGENNDNPVLQEDAVNSILGGRIGLFPPHEQIRNQPPLREEFQSIVTAINDNYRRSP